MNHRTCKTLFFAGTDTNVGKTYVAALTASALRDAGYSVGVYKPVASGCQIEAGKLLAEDANVLWNAAGKPRCLEDVCPQRFEAPLAPPVAAAAEGKVVDANKLRQLARCWEETCDVLIIEGAGGLFSPLADDVLNIDLLQRFPSPKLIVVAADRLGVIHHCLATCLAAEHRGTRPLGIILCNNTPQADQSSATNASQISQCCDVPVLGRVAFGATSLDAELLQKLVN